VKSRYSLKKPGNVHRAGGGVHKILAIKRSVNRAAHTRENSWNWILPQKIAAFSAGM